MEMITVVHTGGPFLDQCWQGWEFLQSFNWGWIMPESVNDGLGFNQEEEEEEGCFRSEINQNTNLSFDLILGKLIPSL